MQRGLRQHVVGDTIDPHRTPECARPVRCTLEESCGAPDSLHEVLRAARSAVAVAVAGRLNSRRSLPRRHCWHWRWGSTLALAAASPAFGLAFGLPPWALALPSRCRWRCRSACRWRPRRLDSVRALVVRCRPGAAATWGSSVVSRHPLEPARCRRAVLGCRRAVRGWHRAVWGWHRAVWGCHRRYGRCHRADGVASTVGTVGGTSAAGEGFS